MTGKYVWVTGPEAEPDRFGDEHPVWYVGIADDDTGDFVGKTYTVRNYDRAIDLGYKIGRDRGLDVEVEADRA